MRRSGKTSAAQAKRRRQQILESRTTTPVRLPAEFVHYVEEQYLPRPAIAKHWDRVRPLVLDSLRGTNVTGAKSLKQHVSHLAHFWAWALENDHPADCRTTLTRAVVDEYARLGMASSQEKSRSDRRSRLRSLADHHNPAQAPFKGVTIRRAAIRPPYTSDEMATIRRVARVQPTYLIRRQMCLCVGLGAGAGIDSPELKLLRFDHVEDRGDDGITITVPGERARVVTVMREYEELLREGLGGLSGAKPLVGRLQTRHNVASDIYARATLLGDVPHLEQARLRSTWLATLMQRPVPLAVLLDAAGLRTARTLVELVPYLHDLAAADTTDGGVLR